MRILLTNDDGIHGPGLKVLEEIARALSDDVWVVAPEMDQSGVSHSLSLNDPLRLREIRPRHVAVDVVYSATIAGALEGTILGLPSFALSQEFSIETRGKPLWETALKFGPPILRKAIEAGIHK